jgi:HPt (histidine-containing phosphotransfer) domain-containing protein
MLDHLPMGVDRRREPRRSQPLETEIVEDIAQAIDDEEQLRQIGALFLDTLARSRSELALAVWERDLEALARLAHRLHGSSATFGAVTLGELAERLEDAALAGHDRLALALARGILREIPPAARELRDVLAPSAR